ncbi:Zn(II)2Cys6 transcription factor [Aspergillus saccharolyticus JOP 1030-1]|uniref:C6 transcription factor n=1 Tax=Aspergillus saccharolyticus JOP 1030-1 TaxID=1450539 RepID=A0A318Z5K6_9EURO|nr:C6 transcription factor [Aspergillus saccharolyticus JOP 1030-1]PYH40093.1 C6 transcription factor [Aspergillus saccharolyticus JOP 1030-1]
MSELRFRSGNAPPRFFKACRWCRKQKMRCDARSQVPCARCRSAGRDCILDPIVDERRRSQRHISPRPSRRQVARSPWNEPTGFDTPSSREQEYSPGPAVQNDPLNASLDDLPDSTDLRSPGTSEQHGQDSQQLSPNDMIAPVSVVHSMSVNLLGSSSIFMDSPNKADLRSDIIARGIISEEQARSMYERFFNGSKNFLALFDPIRDTFDSIRSRSLFCFSVMIYIASRAVIDLRSNTHLQRVLQDEAQRLAEDSFFERPTKVETVQGMILLAAYSEKTWFSTALILRTALDSGLEKSLDTLLSQKDVPRSALSATLEERKLVWQTRTWLISFTLELDVASGTGRKSRIDAVDTTKLRRFLDYPLSLPCDMRTISIIELHQLRSQFRMIVENSKTIREIASIELPAVMSRLQTWWNTWDEIHKNNGFHAGAFQRCSLKLMHNYARIFAFCASLARIQKLRSGSTESDTDTDNSDISHLWRSLASATMDQLGLIISETSYRCQLSWTPTYPALTIAFVTTFSLRIARWRPDLIDQDLLLERAQLICDLLKQPPYPDIHRTVSIFVNYGRALVASQRGQRDDYLDAPDDTRLANEQLGMNKDLDGDKVAISTASALAEQASYGATETIHQGVKDTDLLSMPNTDRQPPARQFPPRPPGPMEAPNWNLCHPIADSFGLFEEEQNDIFDFLPAMPSMPQ